MKKTIVICDDDRDRVKEWVGELQNRREISESYEVSGFEDGTFKALVEELSSRRVAAREGGAAQPVQNPIDKAEILVVDYDLPQLDGFLTGESVAYLARCYSSCGLIVALNQFKSENPFDLTLHDHPESFADLNIGSRQLSNPGLWSRDWRGFRPWAWPVLQEAEAAFSQRVAALLGKLDERILAFVGITEQMAAGLSRDAREYLAPSSPIEEVTFREFVTVSEQGLKSKDVVQSDEALARIAAARVSRWIECFVLPRQDIIVDAPHLVSRFPSVLKGDRASPIPWNRTATAKSHEEAGLADSVSGSLFAPLWVSKPCWDWTKVSVNEQIAEVKDPWSSEKPPFVFAEDLSRFIREESARQFVAAFESPFSRRFICNPSSVESGVELRTELQAVDYRPADRLFL